MAYTSWLLYYSTHRRFSPSFRSFFFIPTCLALFTSLSILFYISTTSNLFFSHQQLSIPRLNKPISFGSSPFQNNIPFPLSNKTTSLLKENGSDGRESTVFIASIGLIPRKKLAFFAGSTNSPVRERLVRSWRNDSEIFTHSGRLTTPCADELLGSKFCLQVKDFEVNTARIADSLYYGCVPVIIANHYDLPFADILNWKSFSVVVATLDIPLLKKILKGISSDQYLMFQNKVLEVRKHFQWHLPPIEHDAFYMVMYELWLRRSSVRVPLNASIDPPQQ